MNHLPTPVFVAVTVLATGAAVLTLPSLAITAAVIIGRRRRAHARSRA